MVQKQSRTHPKKVHALPSNLSTNEVIHVKKDTSKKQNFFLCSSACVQVTTKSKK